MLHAVFRVCRQLEVRLCSRGDGEGQLAKLLAKHLFKFGNRSRVLRWVFPRVEVGEVERICAQVRLEVLCCIQASGFRNFVLQYVSGTSEDLFPLCLAIPQVVGFGLVHVSEHECKFVRVSGCGDGVEYFARHRGVQRVFGRLYQQHRVNILEQRGELNRYVRTTLGVEQTLGVTEHVLIITLGPTGTERAFDPDAGNQRGQQLAPPSLRVSGEPA